MISKAAVVIVSSAVESNSNVSRVKGFLCLSTDVFNLLLATLLSRHTFI